MLWTHNLVLVSFLMKEVYNVTMLIYSVQIAGLNVQLHFTRFL